MNNNQIDINLPIYIQKYIIKILLEKVNRKIIFNEEALKENNKLVVKLALVCWQYHTYISNQLYCCQDFNYHPLIEPFYPPPPLQGRKQYMFENSKYSIYKFENIKLLKLHHREYRYQNTDLNEMINYLNDHLISKLTNLSTIFIDVEHKINSNAVFSIDFVNNLNVPNHVNIEIRKLNAGYYKKMIPNVNHLNSLILDQTKGIGRICNFIDSNIVIDTLKIQGSPILVDSKNLEIINSPNFIDSKLFEDVRDTNYDENAFNTDSNSKLKLLFTFEYFNNKYGPLVSNLFQNISTIRIHAIGLSDILLVITSYPKLKEFKFSTCFNNLERLLKLDPDTSLSLPKEDIKLCSCSNHHKSDFGTWYSIVDFIKTSNLSTLSILDHCLTEEIGHLEIPYDENNDYYHDYDNGDDNSMSSDSESIGEQNSPLNENENENQDENENEFIPKRIEKEQKDSFLNQLFKDCSKSLENVNIQVQTSNLGPLFEIIRSNNSIKNYQFSYYPKFLSKKDDCLNLRNHCIKYPNINLIVNDITKEEESIVMFDNKINK